MSLPETLAFTAAPSRPTLRLVFDEPRVGPQSSLRACWEVYVLPELDDLSPATLVEYETLWKHWERLTANPPASSIDRATIKSFRTKLLETPFRRGKKKCQRTHATVNKLLRMLIAAINPLWPADRHNPGGKSFIPFFEFPSPLPSQKCLTFTYSRAQMTALYDAADACVLPGQRRRSPVNLPILWRTAMVLALNTGPRTFDLFDLTWNDFRWDDYQHGSVYYAARKTAKLQRPPLNSCARIHLDHVRSLGLDPVRVFPHFGKNKTFYKAWKRICAAANVDGDFEDFRKTCSTMHDDISKGVGAWLTGHEVAGVNAQNYQNPTRRVRRVVYRLKNPKGFRLGARQLQALPAEAS